MFKRILGAGLGWSLGGPIGGILGWWLGGKLENRDQELGRGYYGNSGKNTREQYHTTHGDFMFSVLILSSQVMKADNRITIKEVEFVKAFLLRHFNTEETREMMQFLKEVENRTVNLNEVCSQINQEMRREEKYQLVYFLFGISQADGHVHPQELELIRKISILISVPQGMFESMKSQFAKEADPLVQSYHILGVTPQASNEEIKKVFREMSLQNHPDKVSHLGEEVRSSAEEKFKVINEAYITIKNHRGF